MSISLDMRPFRDRLKEAAEHARVEYGQTAIARSLEVSKQTVDQWMGKGRPAPESIFRIADRWKVDARWLATEEGQMLPVKPPTPLAEPSDPSSPEVTRLIKAFAWLMDDERNHLLRDLEAKAATNKAIAKQLGPRFKVASDATMLEVLKRGGDFPPGSKKKSKATRQKRGTQFKEEDPE